jgi:hypothetical protein
MKRSCLFAVALAWVLWIRTQGPNLDDWYGISGFATEAQCQASIKEKMETWRQFKDAQFGNNSVTFASNKTSMTYSCYPDSEDPRAKKPRKP